MEIILLERANNIFSQWWLHIKHEPILNVAGLFIVSIITSVFITLVIGYAYQLYLFFKEGEHYKAPAFTIKRYSAFAGVVITITLIMSLFLAANKTEAYGYYELSGPVKHSINYSNDKMLDNRNAYQKVTIGEHRVIVPKSDMIDVDVSDKVTLVSPNYQFDSIDMLYIDRDKYPPHDAYTIFRNIDVLEGDQH